VSSASLLNANDISSHSFQSPNLFQTILGQLVDIAAAQGLTAMLDVQAADLISVRQLPHHRHHPHHRLLSISNRLSITALTLYRARKRIH